MGGPDSHWGVRASGSSGVSVWGRLAGSREPGAGSHGVLVAPARGSGGLSPPREREGSSGLSREREGRERDVGEPVVFHGDVHPLT
ncbi:hypothetical protein FHR32_001312 [Streptosporangium album]|uniref:Uncharacterized protein n=1 Tax=Streptosporangium album TaxID=47479 RepID=A0A7W7RRS3_9ACTN|nr:hypothetical protein [Streptosporangium album]